MPDSYVNAQVSQLLFVLFKQMEFWGIDIKQSLY